MGQDPSVAAPQDPAVRFHRAVDQGLVQPGDRFDHRAWEQLQKTLLGKTLLFTDNDDWTDPEIVRGYRAQHHV